ncbi:uncharacterized protein LOC118448603 [Vespa mandarinia]|uniref:uncharacterized protein LOC118448603 n=1 Tax=Vespa mandarinia TaxID=7446 RepID=UPI001622858D|nr:uncharacterized protein LOC118448603 [Vespa mandarinia]
MKKLCSHIKSDYDRTYDEEEFNIMEKYTKKIIYFLYGCSLISSSILNLFLYLFGKKDKDQLTLPISINNDLSSWSYYSSLIYQVIMIYLLLTIACACFSSYWASIQHACSQFSIIIRRIHEPFQKHQMCLRKISYNRTPEEEFDWIFDIIKRFVRVTEFVDLINDFSETIYFVIISFGMFLIVFNFLYMFELFTKLKRKIEIIECSSYIISTLLTTYINFYIGQRLLNHSNDASNELCQVPFYVLSVKTQKLLLFAIMRSMKPCILSIGGMFVSSHEVFAWDQYIRIFRIFEDFVVNTDSESLTVMETKKLLKNKSTKWI